MQGYGVFSFARYFGEDETDFPIDYGPVAHLDKIEGDLLLPGQLTQHAHPVDDSDTPVETMLGGVGLSSIAEQRDEDNDEDSPKGKKKKKKTKNSKKKTPTAQKPVINTKPPTQQQEAYYVADTLRRPEFSESLKVAMEKSLGDMTASLTSWQKEFSDVDKMLARTMALVNSSRQERGEKAFNIGALGPASSSVSPNVPEPKRETPHKVGRALAEDSFALFLYR